MHFSLLLLKILLDLESNFLLLRLDDCLVVLAVTLALDALVSQGSLVGLLLFFLNTFFLEVKLVALLAVKLVDQGPKLSFLLIFD